MAIGSKQLTILSGGGSPHSESYRPIYQLIKDEAQRRGIYTQLVDYVGCGHSPDFGKGLDLPDAMAQTRRLLSENPPPKGSTLLSRSFGCDVAVKLLAEYPDEMSGFQRVVLWGPSGMHSYWDLVAKTYDAIECMNEEIESSKGCKLHTDFWKTFSSIEESIKQIRSIAVDITYGTKDKYCDAPFASYLAALVNNYTDCYVRVTEIDGAEHEIGPEAKDGASPEEHERIKREYFDLIFSARNQ